MKNPTTKNLILASSSPRRRSLLGQIVNSFTIAEPRDIDETYPATLPAVEVAPYLSRLKAEAYAVLIGPDDILITADTVVILDGEILGKPHSDEEAFEMLRRMNNRPHRVVTGVTLMSKEKTETFSVETQVYFDNMSDEEFRDYIAEYQPFDKAGAYGIQEWIGCRGIVGIDGCFYNVMGLPINALYQHLKVF